MKMRKMDHFDFIPANREDSCWILYTVLASRTTSITPTWVPVAKLNDGNNC